MALFYLYFAIRSALFTNQLNGKRNSVIIQLTVKVAFEIVPPAMMTP